MRILPWKIPRYPLNWYCTCQNMILMLPNSIWKTNVVPVPASPKQNLINLEAKFRAARLAFPGIKNNVLLRRPFRFEINWSIKYRGTYNIKFVNKELESYLNTCNGEFSFAVGSFLCFKFVLPPIVGQQRRDCSPGNARDVGGQKRVQGGRSPPCGHQACPGTNAEKLFFASTFNRHRGN